MRKAGPAILLILVIALCFWISGAAADTSGSCGTNVTWSLNTAYSTYTLTISGTGAMTDYSYASAVPWYNYRSNIKSIEIIDGVTTIGNYAFYGT